MQSDSAIDNFTDQELFSLSSIKAKKDLVAVDNNEYEDEAGESGTSDNDESHDEAQDGTSSDLDTDEERRRYEEQVEQLLDEAYEQYVVKKEGKTRQRKQAKENEDSLIFEGGNDNDMIHSDQDSENDLGDHEVNPLVVPLAEDMPTQEEVAAKWFSQDVFTEPDEDDILWTFDCDDEMKLDGRGEHPKKKTPKKNKQKTLQQVQVSKANEDFEVVPAPPTDSSDSLSSDDSDEDDIETKAEILAYAKRC